MKTPAPAIALVEEKDAPFGFRSYTRGVHSSERAAMAAARRRAKTGDTVFIVHFPATSRLAVMLHERREHWLVGHIDATTQQAVDATWRAR